VGIRQVAEEHCADDAEHGGARADGEREHEDRSDREAGIAAEPAQGEAEIGRKVVERAHAGGVERLLAPALEAAERAEGLAARGAGIGARPDAGGDVALEVIVEFLVELALPAAAEGQRAEPLEEIGDHRSASRIRRIPFTAAAARRQAAVSASSWRRPFDVRA
jgi:hypothetical protein